MEQKILLKDIEIERVHGVGHIKRNKKRAIVVKLASFKYKQKILFANRKIKGFSSNINEQISKETLEIRREKWNTFKQL